MILWAGETDFPNLGLTFSLCMGSANYLASPVQNPDHNDLKAFVSCDISQAGDHAEEHEFEVRWLQPASHQKPRQDPGGAPWHIWDSASRPRPPHTPGTLHQWQGEELPLFLPQDSSDHAHLLSLLPALHMGSPSILLCRNYSLHLQMLQRNYASRVEWAGLGGDRLRGLEKA